MKNNRVVKLSKSYYQLEWALNINEHRDLIIIIFFKYYFYYGIYAILI